MADITDLKSVAERRAGSSPAIPTKPRNNYGASTLEGKMLSPTIGEVKGPVTVVRIHNAPPFTDPDETLSLRRADTSSR